MIQNHWEPILGTQNLGSIVRTSKTIGPNTMDPKISFPTCTHFFVHESACICIHNFWLAISRVYVIWLRGTCIYAFFFHFESLNYDLPSEWVAIKDNTCAIVPNLCHNANDPPLGLDGNPKSIKVILPLWHQGQRVMSPLSTRWNLCSSMLSMLRLTVGKACRKMVYKK